MELKVAVQELEKERETIERKLVDVMVVVEALQIQVCIFNISLHGPNFGINSYFSFVL